MRCSRSLKALSCRLDVFRCLTMEDGADQDCTVQPQRPIERQPIVGNGSIRVSGRQDRSRPFRRRTPGRAPPLLPSETGVRPASARSGAKPDRTASSHNAPQARRLRRSSPIESAPCVTCSSSATAIKMRSWSRVTTPILAVAWARLFEFID